MKNQVSTVQCEATGGGLPPSPASSLNDILVEIAKTPLMAYPSKRVWLCGTCNEFKILPRFMAECPACGNTDLEPVCCEHGGCNEWATRTEEGLVAGPTARHYMESVSTPFCPRH